MEFDATTTALVFVGIIAVGTVGVSMAPMSTSTVFMMVVPSMVVFGAIMLWVGTKFGEHRAGASGQE